MSFSTTYSITALSLRTESFKLALFMIAWARQHSTYPDVAVELNSNVVFISQFGHAWTREHLCGDTYYSL